MVFRIVQISFSKILKDLHEYSKSSKSMKQVLPEDMAKCLIWECCALQESLQTPSCDFSSTSSLLEDHWPAFDMPGLCLQTKLLKCVANKRHQVAQNSNLLLKLCLKYHWIFCIAAGTTSCTCSGWWGWWQGSCCRGEVVVKWCEVLWSNQASQPTC